jgi:hypothetical protein
VLVCGAKSASCPK